MKKLLICILGITVISSNLMASHPGDTYSYNGAVVDGGTDCEAFCGSTPANGPYQGKKGWYCYCPNLV